MLLTMIRSGSSELRERALRGGAETLPEAELEALLREEADDVARNAGLEMLKLRGRRSFDLGVRLLADADADVVLQGVLLLDAIGDPRAWAHVRPLLYSDDDNVVQAAMIAAGHLGSSGTAADIVPFLERNLWLQMAALATLGQLRSRAAVPAVVRLLGNDDLRDLAAEALARIGGAAAARALSEHWRSNEGELDAGQWLPLIAQALTDSDATARAPLLRQRLLDYLHSDAPGVAAAAAAAILALGAGDGDGAALDVLIAQHPDREHLPPCLARRADLAEWLITSGPPDWGYALFLRNRDCVPLEAVVALFLRCPASRDTIAPLLRKKRAAVVPLAKDRGDLLLLEAVGENVAADVAVLPAEERAAVVAQLRGRRTLASLPWLQWIDEDRVRFAPLLGDVVARRRVAELLPIVRRELANDPLPELVACAAAMRDRASAPLVIAALERCQPAARATLFDAIAAIGGVRGRRILQELCAGHDRDDVRLAARALAQHATASDAALLRDLAASADWAVRYAAADALGRLAAPENAVALGLLAADPSPLVAQRARAALDAAGGPH
ncbi:MAG TPA: HEAT repeat domain-containing protein [Thermoanaerobaculia bacterium]|nr:HEAT repeat domain-containing protein [Thermoanaerobaculia bacterium]